jgi:SAM-dependent methyltransferase
MLGLYNKDARLRHWGGSGWKTKNQGDSLAFPFSGLMDFFHAKDVLEIGPGEGRQANYTMPFCASYSVADIINVVLDSPLYLGCKHRFLIESYDVDFGIQFDVIHFWYVLHHVPRVEIRDFVDFLCRHLKPGGKVMFNTPVLEYDDGCYGDDGVNTTPWSIEEVHGAFNHKFKALVEDRSFYGRSNGYIYVGEARL